MPESILVGFDVKDISKSIMVLQQKINRKPTPTLSNQTFWKLFFYSHTLHFHKFAARWHGQELFLFLSSWMHKIMQFFVSGSHLLIPEEKENIWSELESNPGPFASQATTLTTRPLLLGQIVVIQDACNFRNSYCTDVNASSSLKIGRVNILEAS